MASCETEADGSQHKAKQQQNSELYWLDLSHSNLIPALWSNLPVELIERVIRNLPIDAMLRLSSVCKAWKAYISSYGNACICYKAPPKGPWCLAVIPEMECLAVFDVGTNKWHHLRFPSLAGKYKMKPFRADGGIACFHNFDNSRFFIYNVLTSTCSVVTPEQWRVGSADSKVWVVIEPLDEFMVVMVNKESGLCEVYESYNKQWHKSGRPPYYLNVSQISSSQGRSVCCDGMLYMISESPFDLVTFDTIMGTWTKLYVRWPEESSHHILSEYRGRIYMLAMQKVHNHLSFSEWELNSTSMLWTKVGTMPELFCLGDFNDGDKNDWNVQCLANRGLVILKFVRKNEDEHLVLYNRTQMYWTSIPSPLQP